MKHPGAPRDSGYNTTPSVRSAPAGYVLRRNPNLSVAPTSEDIHANTRVLKMTNDLSGKDNNCCTQARDDSNNTFRQVDTQGNMH